MCKSKEVSYRLAPNSGTGSVGGSIRLRKNAKYYERTQHLVENKEGALEEPSKYLKQSNLVKITQHVIDRQAGYSDETPGEMHRDTRTET